MLKTSVIVDSTIRFDFILSDIFIDLDIGITTAGDILAIINPKISDYEKIASEHIDRKIR